MKPEYDWQPTLVVGFVIVYIILWCMIVFTYVGHR